MPFSGNHDDDAEDNTEMMCYGNKAESEEVEDGTLVSVSLFLCLSCYLIINFFE